MAAVAGVSVASASNALTGNRSTSEAVRQKVLAAAKRLGYRPNRAAQSLIVGKSRVVGLLVPDITNPFFPETVQAIERGLYEQGYSLILCSTEMDAAREAHYLKILQEQQVEGLIYIRSSNQPAPGLATLARRNIKIVTLDEKIEATPYVGVYADSYEGGKQLAEHLLALGHRHFGLVSGPVLFSTAQERRAGFEDALRSAGVELQPSCVAVGDYRLEGGQTAAFGLLQHSKITAIFAANDLMAFGVMRAARQLGRKIPQDLSIVGFNDIKAASLVEPALTTVRQPVEAMAQVAIDRLKTLIGGQDAAEPQTTLPCTLCIRESSAAVPQAK